MPSIRKIFMAHSPPCDNLCCSGFYHTESMSDVKGDLSNDLHPIFANHRFLLGASIDPSTILTARKFASRLITTDSLLPFWHTMFFTTPKRMKEKNPKGANQYVFEEPPGALTDRQAATTKRFLTTLAKCVTFHVYSPEDGAKDAQCVSDFKTKAPPSFSKNVSKIELSTALMQDFLVQQQSPDAAARARSTFEIGVTLAHEVSHAALVATHKMNEDDTYYFGNSPAAEEGYELEFRAFGGIFRERGMPDETPPHYWIDGKASTLQRWSVLVDWPDSTIVERYKRDGYTIGDRRPLYSTTCIWHIPFSFFFEILTDAFWDQKVAAQGAEALKLPKTVGYMTVSGPGAISGCLWPEDIKLYPGVAVPAGYTLMPSGLLVPAHTWHPLGPMDVEGDDEDIEDTKIADVWRQGKSCRQIGRREKISE